MATDPLVAAALDLAAQGPDPARWTSITSAAAFMEEESVTQLDAALRRWPDRMRVAPSQWATDPRSDPPVGMRVARRLEVLNTRLASRRLARLLDGGHLSSLTSLALVGNGLDAAAIRVLGRSDGLGRLEDLEVSDALVGSLVLEAVAAAPYFARLVQLTAVGDQIGPDGAEALAACDLGRLAGLNLALNALGDQGIAALAKSNARFRTLDLSENTIGATGVRVLVSSDPFHELEQLWLAYDEVGPDAGPELLVRLPRLRTLDLRSTGVDDDGLQKILALDLGRLDQLRLGRNPISDDARQNALAGPFGPKLDFQDR